MKGRSASGSETGGRRRRATTGAVDVALERLRERLEGLAGDARARVGRLEPLSSSPSSARRASAAAMSSGWPGGAGRVDRGHAREGGLERRRGGAAQGGDEARRPGDLARAGGRVEAAARVHLLAQRAGHVRPAAQRPGAQDDELPVGQRRERARSPSPRGPPRPAATRGRSGGAGAPGRRARLSRPIGTRVYSPGKRSRAASSTRSSVAVSASIRERSFSRWRLSGRVREPLGRVEGRDGEARRLAEREEREAGDARLVRVHDVEAVAGQREEQIRLGAERNADPAARRDRDRPGRSPRTAGATRPSAPACAARAAPARARPRGSTGRGRRPRGRAPARPTRHPPRGR